MNYSKALKLIIRKRNIKMDTLSQKMYISKNWLNKVLSDKTWKPRLDTILHFCYCLEVNVFDFFKLAKWSSSTQTCRLFSLDYSKCKTQRNKILQLEPSHIAQTLYYFRKYNDLTQRETRKLTTFQLSSISLRESNRYNNMPTMQTLELYCEAFNISIEMFITKMFSFVSFE